ncbi:hypothetical protein DLAC_01283 [Tieghemostelium lacteum]|uniref:Uncharacterized protein n=1 Tax=Tieghemostelium lacteum TaxID=361077 RepID=A0A152A8C0_TIELA|nr:hypothetical protein DLAC_01283 [Tieghemostelium lacteum]|eukprot:KYR02444.1 hypothetical protein DLAC_01283 [Tieghemostelium lacteum]
MDPFSSDSLPESYLISLESSGNSPSKLFHHNHHAPLYHHNQQTKTPPTSYNSSSIGGSLVKSNNVNGKVLYTPSPSRGGGNSGSGGGGNIFPSFQLISPLNFNITTTPSANQIHHQPQENLILDPQTPFDYPLTFNTPNLVHHTQTHNNFIDSDEFSHTHHSQYLDPSSLSNTNTIDPNSNNHQHYTNDYLLPILDFSLDLTKLIKSSSQQINNNIQQQNNSNNNTNNVIDSTIQQTSLYKLLRIYIHEPTTENIYNEENTTQLPPPLEIEPLDSLPFKPELRSPHSKEEFDKLIRDQNSSSTETLFKSHLESFKDIRKSFRENFKKKKSRYTESLNIINNIIKNHQSAINTPTTTTT